MATLFTSSFLPKLSLRPKYSTKRSKLPYSSKHSSLNIIDKDTTDATTRPAQPLTKHAPSLPARIFDEIDKFINTHIDPPRKSCYDPRHVLSDNFAPVDELPPTECEVVAGSLPPTLHGGAYVRNGPNPHIFPRGPHHLFDGDGMLHSVKISDDGEAIFCSRYVQTNKYKTEHEIGLPVFPKVFSDFNSLLGMVARGALIAARVLAGQINIGKGTGLANTGLSLIGGQLYALGDSDLPYSIKIGADGEIYTLGRRDFDGKLKISMAGHNKTDTETGETFACSCRPFNYPFLTFFRIGANGEKSPDVPIFSMKAPTLVHDLAITKKYAIFNEMQIGWNPTAVVTGNSMVGIDLKKVPRVGVIPRYAADEAEMQWFEVAGFNCIHLTNAWDEDDGDSIVLVAPNILAGEHTLERQDLIHVSIEKLKIDLRTGLVSRIPTCAPGIWSLQ